MPKYERADRGKQIEFLAERQGWKCACCGRHAQVLCLDHCHRLNAARAMLCMRCNTALGMMRESPLDCLRLAAYATKCEALAQEGIERAAKTFGIPSARLPIDDQDCVRKAKVLEYVRSHGGSQNSIEKGIGVRRDTVRRTLRELEAEGAIVKSKGPRGAHLWRATRA
jgi:DNA invertase Pin-like site-specific DNA recombinase